MTHVDDVHLRGEQDPESEPGLDRPPGLPERDRGRSPWPWVVVGILALALAAGGAWWLSRSEEPEVEPPPTTAEAPPAEPDAAPARTFALPALDQSDTLVRELVGALSSHPQLARWLVHDDLVRRAAKIVGNVAWGEDPSTHVSFLRPKEPFRVQAQGPVALVDPRSYERYDLAVDVFASIDAEGAATLYRDVRPLLAEAYAELGYPGTWEDAVRSAVRVVLATPIPEQNVEVTRDAVTYRYVDPELESLAPAQKLVLRTGPRNAARLRSKVRELASAAGIEA
jgi:hypothetical protein